MAVSDEVAEAILGAFVSSTLSNSHLEPANVVDALSCLADSAFSVSKSLTALKSEEGSEPIVRAAQNITHGLMSISYALKDVAEAIDRYGRKSLASGKSRPVHRKPKGETRC